MERFLEKRCVSNGTLLFLFNQCLFEGSKCVVEYIRRDRNDRDSFKNE